jgi:hypothetical protein
MTSQRIAVTRATDAYPLVVNGQTAAAQWVTLTMLLRGAPETGPPHALLFAEPVPSHSGAETGWYSEAEGMPSPIAALPDAEHARTAERLSELVAGARALAGRLRGRREGGERHFAELIERALCLPGRDHVYVVGDQPVLVGWGHARTGEPPEPVPITGWAKPHEPPTRGARWPSPASLASGQAVSWWRRLGSTGALWAPASASNPAELVRARGGRVGKLQITLVWHSFDDLDLHVVCPNDQRIWFNGKHAGGGELDIDENYTPPFRRDPVEHIVFPSPAPGAYRVLVGLYALRSAAPPIPFRLIIHRDGARNVTVKGAAATAGSIQPVTVIEVLAP